MRERVSERERTRKRGSVCTCTGEEERRKGKLGVQETDLFLFFFGFYFCLINLLFLVSHREKGSRSAKGSDCLLERVCVFFLARRGGTRRQ